MINMRQEEANAAYAYIKYMRLALVDQLERRQPPYTKKEDFEIIEETFERFKYAVQREKELASIANASR